jgi:hypothetical protein
MTDVETSANLKVQQANRLAQFFETFSLLSLTLIICGFLLLESVHLLLWTIFFSVTAAGSLLLAVRYRFLAVRRYRSVYFDISDQRLHTLEVTKIPADVLPHLQLFAGKRIRGEGRFFNRLADAVGSERSAEVKARIFKYTHVD